MDWDDIEIGEEYYIHRVKDYKTKEVYTTFSYPQKARIAGKQIGNDFYVWYQLQVRKFDKPRRFYLNYDDICKTKEESWDKMIDDAIKQVEQSYSLAKYYESVVETLRKQKQEDLSNE